MDSVSFLGLLLSLPLSLSLSLLRSQHAHVHINVCLYVSIYLAVYLCVYVRINEYDLSRCNIPLYIQIHTYPERESYDKVIVSELRAT